MELIHHPATLTSICSIQLNASACPVHRNRAVEAGKVLDRIRQKHDQIGLVSHAAMRPISSANPISSAAMQVPAAKAAIVGSPAWTRTANSRGIDPWGTKVDPLSVPPAIATPWRSARPKDSSF